MLRDSVGVGRRGGKGGRARPAEVVTIADIKRLDAMLAVLTQKPDEAADERTSDAWAVLADRRIRGV